MEIEVKNCKYCPFVQQPNTGGEIKHWCGVYDKFPVIPDATTIPDWCPLRKEPITIKLKA